MALLLQRLVTLVVMFGQASGDYDCICNYNVEAKVYSVMDPRTTPIGSMYEFDCKPKLELTGSNQQWVAVAYEHQVGYVQTNTDVETQTCAGQPTGDDGITTNDPSTQSSVTTDDPVTLGQTQPETSASPMTSSTWQPTNPSTTTTRKQTSTTTYTTIRDTTTPVQTTKSVTVDTTSTSSSTVPSPTTSFSVGDKTLCSARTVQFSSSHRGIVGQFEDSCYVIVPQIQHWLQAELSCNSAGGHLVDVTKTSEHNYLYNLLQSQFQHSVWIGLNDQQSEGSFQWSSGKPLNYTNWAVHNHFSDSFEDCVVMDTRTQSGKWDDRECGFESYSYICEFGIGGLQPASTQTSVTLGPGSSTSDGNTDLCPTMIRAHTASQGAVLAQYGKNCYELLLNSRVSWEHGENLCSYNGGHLAHVTNSKEQAFIDGFMTRHNPDHAVWIGLHDTIQEGQFQWTSGDAFQYTNWIVGNADNTLGGHNAEDCVALVPQRGGKWDDVSCGYEEIFGQDSGEVHYAFCQYKIHPAQVLVG